MMKKLIVFALLVATLFCVMTFSVSAERSFDEVAKPKIGGKYYLCATVDGTDYYYRVTRGSAGESVTDTNPYSLYVTSDPDDKNLKEFTLEKLGQAFYLGYPSGTKTHKIYSADVTMNGLVDTGINSSLNLQRHGFYWDAANKQIFSMKNDEKYVLAVKMLKNKNSGEEELHMLSVPYKEVKDGEAVAVRFVSLHQHTFSNKLTGNEYSHWFPCECGEKSTIQMHQVDTWTVTKEATKGEEGSRTGICTLCGETAVEGIPALKEKKDDEKDDKTELAIALDPIAIAVAAVLVISGVAVMIFGKKSDKKKNSQ